MDMKQLIILMGLILWSGIARAQEAIFQFGEDTDLQTLTSGNTFDGTPVNWIQVNTEADTWEVKGEELVCTGHPIGVVRSEKRYENFLLHIEWKHMEAGGN